MAKLRLVAGCIVLAVLLSPVVSWGQVVRLTLPSGLVVSADHFVGKPDYPAILLLPGFLQTRLAPPMSSLGRALADEGYTVLIPTLSLGYSHRNQTLECEAVHKHTMSGDTAEVSFWIGWLNKQSTQPLILIGHSSGSNVILNYIANKPAKKIRGAILISVVPTKIHRAEYLRARMDVANPMTARELRQYSLTYCQHNYLSTAAGYLSYAAWDSDMVLAMLHKVKIPMQIIIGDADKVFPPGWKEQLVQAYPSLVIIKGTGHFFEDMHEFDLLDQVNSILNQWRGVSS